MDLNLSPLKRIVETVAGPASYATTGFNYYSNVAPKSILYAQVHAHGGYVADVSSIQPNVTTTVTLLVYTAPGTGVAGGTNLSGVNFDIEYVGW